MNDFPEKRDTKETIERTQARAYGSEGAPMVLYGVHPLIHSDALRIHQDTLNEHSSGAQTGRDVIKVASVTSQRPVTPTGTVT